MILQLSLLSFVGILSLNQAAKTFIDKYYSEGSTNDKIKMIKSFEYTMKKCKEYGYKPSITVWFDNKNKTNCLFQDIRITEENINLIKECLISQNWKLLLGNTGGSSTVDFENATNGMFKSYHFTFWIDYIDDKNKI